MLRRGHERADRSKITLLYDNERLAGSKVRPSLTGTPINTLFTTCWSTRYGWLIFSGENPAVCFTVYVNRAVEQRIRAPMGTGCLVEQDGGPEWMFPFAAWDIGVIIGERGVVIEKLTRDIFMVYTVIRV